MYYIILYMSLLRFSKENTLYLLLNIIGHDIIHDYGDPNSERWKKVKDYVQTFYSNYTFGLPKLGGAEKRKAESSSGSETMIDSESVSEEPSLKTRKISDNVYGFSSNSTSNSTSNLSSEPSFPGVGQKIGQGSSEIIHYPLNDEYVQMQSDLKYFMDDIKSEIIMSYFGYYIIFILKNENQNKFDFMKQNPFLFFPDLRENDQDIVYDIFDDIADNFYSYCEINKVNTSQMDYEEYYNLLSNFLTGDYVELSVYKNINFNNVNNDNMNNDNNNKNNDMEISGGRGKKDSYLTIEECRNLVSEIEDSLNPEKKPEITQMMNDMTRLASQTSISESNINEYRELRKNLINHFKEIYNKNSANKEAGCLELIKPLRERPIRNLDIQNDVTNIVKKSLIDIYAQISEDDENQRRIEAKQSAENSKKEGKLSSEDKLAVKDFVNLISKMSLYLTGCCDGNGIIKEEINKLNLSKESALRKQINILLPIAEWRENPNWNEIFDKNLDANLIEYFKKNKNYIKMSSDYKCNFTGSNNYVINNAAPIGDLENVAFCPYTSIIDGMFQCSWGKDSFSNTEYGNMDFKILSDNNKDLYYNGILSINNKSSKKNNYPLNINISLDVKLPFVQIMNNKNVDISKANELKAHVVLKNTLINIIKYIEKLKISDRDIIFKNNEIFYNLFDYGINNKNEIFKIIYQEILFKGVGDLFQEINAVAKYGGYKMDNTYFTDKNILSYKETNGNQVRCFCANDRPSGTRYIFMLTNGKENEINTKSFGGYFSGNLEVMVKDKSNQYQCQISSTKRKQMGGSLRKKIKNKKTIKINKKNKRKQKTYRYKIKPDSFTRKNKK